VVEREGRERRLQGQQPIQLEVGLGGGLKGDRRRGECVSDQTGSDGTGVTGAESARSASY
jgi:hypothetical protein